MTNLDTLRGFPLFRVSSSESWSISRSIRSASLFRRRDRSNPVTFLPQVVLKALRAAATATSMSFAEPMTNKRKHFRCLAMTMESSEDPAVQRKIAPIALIDACTKYPRQKKRWQTKFDCFQEKQAMKDTHRRRGNI